MTKGSAIVAVLVAFVGGLTAGNLACKGGSLGKEVTTEVGSDKAAVKAPKPGEVERYKVPLTGKDPYQGKEDALVTIVEVSDFQCPFCGRVEPTIDKIKKEYGSKVKVVWMDNPLPFHKQALPAHMLAQEAFAQQGNAGFWKMHKKLFQNQRALGRENLEKYAQEQGLDMAKVKAALDQKTHEAGIRKDQSVAKIFGASGTPAFFINGRKLSGAQPFSNFKKIIDEEIANAQKLLNAGTPKSKLYAEVTKNALTKAKPKKRQARKQPDPNAVYKVPVSDKEPSKGAKTPLVTIVEYSDFQCPFCKRVEPTVDQIIQKFGKDVRVVWKNNPLPFHKDAMPAALAAQEAFAQKGSKGFWKMHKLLFENPRKLKREDLEKHAKSLGLNMKKFAKALDDKTHEALIKEQQGLARQLGATGTPSFFINGRNLRGAQPFAAFEKVINEEIKKAQALIKKGTPKSKVYEELTKKGATKAKFVDGPGKPAGPDPNKIYKISDVKDAPRKGAKNAKVVIQEFSDFECPFCGRVNPTMEKVMKEYGDRVQVVWRHYPLPFHKHAKMAHMASVEVHKQGGDKKFWKYHDTLFANRRNLKEEDLVKYAQELGGINIDKFKAALQNKTHEARVEADVNAVRKSGARIGTPSFFINGKLLQGAQPFENFKKAIEDALKAKG